MSSSQDITLTAQEQDLITRLKSFRVPEMAHILEEQLKDPNADHIPFKRNLQIFLGAGKSLNEQYEFVSALLTRISWTNPFIISDWRERYGYSNKRLLQILWKRIYKKWNASSFGSV